MRCGREKVFFYEMKYRTGIEMRIKHKQKKQIQYILQADFQHRAGLRNTGANRAHRSVIQRGSVLQQQPEEVGVDAAPHEALPPINLVGRFAAHDGDQRVADVTI